MFGYIIINKSELKFKEYDIYHSYYCGMCQSLKKQCGYKGQLSLNYDLTFLAILLSGLYEPETLNKLSRCPIHPFHQYEKLSNECIDYAAKMSLILSYLKCQDDWLDERKWMRHGYQYGLHQTYVRIKKEYPLKIEKIENCLNDIHHLELENCQNIDQISQCFGIVMAEICCYKDDEWKDELYQFGFYLGQFIYLMDAYDDIEKDIKNHTYNPFIHMKDQANFEEYCYGLLELMIARASEIFEYLPIVDNVEIMRNILYSGVWSKYELRKKKRMGESS